MTKADLVEKIAAAAGLSKAEAEEAVRTVLDSIVEALRRKEKIELRGFGSFRLRQRRPRQGRNPKTGARVEVPGKVVPYFKPGKELREMLNPEPSAAAPGMSDETAARGEADAAGSVTTGGDTALNADPLP